MRHRKSVMQGHFLEQGDTQDLENCVETLRQPEALLQDRDEHVHSDRNPDLGLHGVLGGAVEGLDPQVLLDTLEEEFHAPPRLVQVGDSEGR